MKILYFSFAQNCSSYNEFDSKYWSIKADPYDLWRIVFSHKHLIPIAEVDE